MTILITPRDRLFPYAVALTLSKQNMDHVREAEIVNARSDMRNLLRESLEKSDLTYASILGDTINGEAIIAGVRMDSDTINDDKPRHRIWMAASSGIGKYPKLVISICREGLRRFEAFLGTGVLWQCIPMEYEAGCRFAQYFGFNKVRCVPGIRGEPVWVFAKEF